MAAMNDLRPNPNVIATRIGAICPSASLCLYPRRDPGKRFGLSDHLDGSRSIDEVIFETAEDENLDVLPSGRAEAGEVIDLLRSQSFSILLRKVAKRYDRIFIDSAPILAVADTVEVAVHCDAALLVVRAGETRGRELTEAIRVLRSSRVETLGTVLVGATSELSDVYSYGYSGR